MSPEEAREWVDNKLTKPSQTESTILDMMASPEFGPSIDGIVDNTGLTRYRAAYMIRQHMLGEG
jgi:hypothetical protein